MLAVSWGFLWVAQGWSLLGRGVGLGVGGVAVCAVFLVSTRERRAREQGRLGRAAVLARACGASADPMALLEVQTGGRVVWANPAMTGRPETGAGDGWGVEPRGLESVVGLGPGDGRWASLRLGETWQGEAEVRRPDGTSWVASQILSPVRGPEGGVSHVLAVFRDVSVRRQMDLELRKLNELQARDMESMRASSAAILRDLELFAYAVSHDLRAPLRAIDFFGRELVDHAGGSLDSESRGYLDRVFTARRRMAQIIDGMMSLFHLGRGEMRWVDLDVTELAEDALGELHRAHPGRGVSVVVQPGMRARGDLRLVQAALASLLDNAWKFTGRRPDARIEVGALEREDGRVFFVRDNGAGFDMAYADRLFTSIRRLHTQDEYEGCGIGLVSVQRALQRHHGRVWVEAAEGQGATFYFTLGTPPNGSKGAPGAGAVFRGPVGGGA
jgi:signal transduction histidine kinase